MKQAVAILLTILLSGQLIFQASYLIYWKSNQIYITAKFCENKSRPQMHCNGKCHLIKQLNHVGKCTADNSHIPVSLIKLKFPDALLPDREATAPEEVVSISAKAQACRDFLRFPKGFSRSEDNPPELI